MIDEAQLSKTAITWSCHVQPIENVLCALSGIIATHAVQFAGAFHSRLVARKLNVALTELINNVLENFSDGQSALTVSWTIGGDVLTTKVAANATREQYETVLATVQHINAAESPKALLRSTIKARHKERLKGGLGLMRLVAENNFEVDVGYEEPVLTVGTRIVVGEIE